MLNAITHRGLYRAGHEWLRQLLFGAAFIIPSMYLLEHGQLRILVALTCLGGLLLLWRISRTTAICLNFAYLILLGDIRRIANLFTGESGLDPLLLVGALFAIFVAFPLFSHIRVKDNLSKVMLTLLSVMILEMFNPKQGSLFVGLSAGLFWIVPLLWFWIGRRYATEELVSKVLFGVVAPLGILAAFLGLYQNFVGFLPWEQVWIDNALAAGFNSLLIGNKVRAFGYSVNSVEFAELMLITCVMIFPLLKSKKAFFTLFLPVLLVSIVLASSRTVIVKIIFGAAAMWAVRGYGGANRAKVIPRMIFALVFGIGGLAYSASHVASDEASVSSRSSTSDLATSHVVQGLAHPLDSKSSTAGLHAGMFTGGIITGIVNPFGFGLGSVTLAAGKFGGGGGSSELDISDAFISMGVVGGVCFLLMIFYTVRYMLEHLTHNQKDLSYCLVGILAAMLGGWVAQGRYALAPLMCFLIGFVAKQHIDRNESLALLKSAMTPTEQTER